MDKINETYLVKIDEGMTYDELKIFAKSKGLEGKELASLMRELDAVLLQKNEERAARQQAKEWMWVGISFCLIAMIMLLYSFFDSESFYVYLVYGIFIGGVLIFGAGWQKKKEQN